MPSYARTLLEEVWWFRRFFSCNIAIDRVVEVIDSEVGAGASCNFTHSSEWQPGIQPKGLALMINKALRSNPQSRVTIAKADIRDLDARVAAEYTQYQCYVEIDNLEPHLLRLDQLRPHYFQGNEFANRIMKGFQYTNVPPGNSFVYIDDDVESLEPKDSVQIRKMTEDDAKDYVLEMIELTWEVKKESWKVMLALAEEEAKAKRELKRAAEAEEIKSEIIEEDDERRDPSYGAFRGVTGA
ncbi:uncharacterized protein MYCFIDRAFT_81728 [Pseudocercospora fijiensis CIRAD86]|uniref:Uncharacterized protein n=1 Tax=Pseudocercospora fijiensis (strain CIRAD86) TaxID=383855 RepID=M2Z0N6_PSEFD|nr:uncharacterized protein MYCFIDRAFT_81728 [Pseudocercospora fijiensis CIRAD86]EME83405.1 hypothetical protein MYCFIDRAFT_81728 [Pseudocercospora fijiensis CIRAD86]